MTWLERRFVALWRDIVIGTGSYIGGGAIIIGPVSIGVTPSSVRAQSSRKTFRPGHSSGVFRRA
jgi:serine acetyltransferase